jgi:Exostosin family
MLFKPFLSPKLQLWQTEAYREIGVEISTFDHQKVIFPKRFYVPIQGFDHTKTFDFCFIGAYKVDAETAARRAWLIDFIKREFSANSYLQFTDKETKRGYVSMGVFDFTLLRTGFVPKEVPVKERNFFDEHYYQVMCRSQFTLCPAGDRRWSMRFYEAIMCKSIPILERRTHHRSIREALRGYRFYTRSEKFIYKQAWVEHNYNIFLKHHTLAGDSRPGCKPT